MAFLNRLFNRKSKTELAVSTQQGTPLRRSLTDPASAVARSRSSSLEEKDTFELAPPSRLAAARPRRAGCELSRAKTSFEVGSVRSSNSSAAEPASTSSDGVKNQYRTLKALHRSRLHTIVAAQDRHSKRTVVLKTFYKARLSAALRAKLEAEVHHLRALVGVPGVVQYLNHFEDEECVYIVLERAPGTTLIELIANCGGRLPEATLVPDILIPLALLLADLHRRGIVHRHVKPEHVLCAPDSASVTLVDFADAANTKQRCLNNRAGTLEYMAPEVLDKPTDEEVFHQVLYNGMSEEELPQYDEKADVWSLGAVAYEALTGCQPFLADTPADLVAAQRELLAEPDHASGGGGGAGGGASGGSGGGPRIFAGKPLSAEARSFLASVLQLDPLNRPSAEKLLQHPLLQRYWPRYQAKQVSLLASGGVGVGVEVGPVPRVATAPGMIPTQVTVAATVPVPAPAGPGEGLPPSAPSRAAGLAAAAAAGEVTAAARAAGCVAPVAAAGCPPKAANILLAAPLQFPVR